MGRFKENRLNGSGDMERTRNSRVNILTLSLGGWVICFVHRLTKRNIRVKYYENRSKGSGDMEQKRNSRVNPLTLTVTLTLSLGSWVMCSAHRLTKRNI